MLKSRILSDKLLRLKSNQLKDHKLYAKINNHENVKILMKAHSFAVWDFMTLLKGLQRNITCVDKVWVPRKDTASVRFINEIVLDEESDKVDNGQAISHYELYLKAMDDVGADTKPVKSFVESVSSGKDVYDSLEDTDVPEYIKSFVKSTLQISERSTAEIASSFFFGREDPIPMMFQKFVDEIPNEKQYEYLKLYLDRHIELDGDEHGDLAFKLLENISGGNSKTDDIIIKTAIESIDNRIKLWDGVLDEIKSNV